jgi:TatD DNase family protein
MLIDTHCHLTDERYSADVEQVIRRASVNGVDKMLCPGTSVQDSEQVIKLARKYPEIVYAAVGIHPEEIIEDKSSDHSLKQGSELRKLFESNREYIVAVGEVGTDRNTEKLISRMSEQKEMFRVQCEIALEYDLPVVVHTRDSMQETLEVLDQLPSMPRGHFHCWSDSDEALDAVLARGFYVGFCGNVTYKNNEKLREQAKRVPGDRLLLETDSPYLPPMGKRGERNEPGNVKITATVIAETRGIGVEEVAEITSHNANKLYGI